MRDKKERSEIAYDGKVIGFLFREASRECRGYPVLMILLVLLKAMAPLAWVIGPRYILAELTGENRMPMLLTILAVFLGAVLILDGGSRLLENYMTLQNEKIMLASHRKIAITTMECDYAYLEDAATLELKDKAMHGLWYSGGVYGMTNGMVQFLSSLLTVLGLVSLIVTLNPLLTVLLLVLAAAVTIINNRLRSMVYRFWDLLQVFNRKFGYLSNLTFDFRYGKDIRLFGMADMIEEKNEENRRKTHEYYIGQGKREFRFLSALDVMTFLQTLLIYGFTGALAVMGKIEIPDFVMHLSAATSLMTTCTALTRSVIDLKRVTQYTCSFYEFCRLPVLQVEGTRDVTTLPPRLEIRFENITFTYPGTERPALRNVSLTLAPGEKLSIVGMNGAGKTTMIKLLLRLYDPDEGRILINGTNIREFKREDYWKLFSAVFQDYRIFAGTVLENIGAEEDGDRERVERTFSSANFTEVVNDLPKGAETQLMKIFDDEGVELSGGQGSRLALARAIYKDAPVVVLDEPTAALDPLAEYELYHRFHEMVEGKSTIFISHRLSSCAFCDNVAVFDDGQLVEYGPHKELLKLENGTYAAMWNAQAQYYV